MDDAGAGLSDASSPGSSQGISPCPPGEPSASQDIGFDTVQSLSALPALSIVVGSIVLVISLS